MFTSIACVLCQIICIHPISTPRKRYGPYFKSWALYLDTWVLTWNNPLLSAPKRKREEKGARWGAKIKNEGGGEIRQEVGEGSAL